MDTHSTSPTTTRKRTHLKPSQIYILQESFTANPLPDSSARSKLARELAVTERTIQIWFQNRRAKARKADSVLTFPSNTDGPGVTGGNTSTSSLLKPGFLDSNTRHPTPPRYQATFRTMMTPERFEELKHQDGQQIRRRPRSRSKPEPKSSHLLNSINSRAMSERIHSSDKALFPAATVSSSTFGLGQHPNTANTPLQMVPLPVNVLRIGSWTRFAYAAPNTNQKDWDLVCYGSPVDRELIWRVQAEGHHFRIQVGFDNIKQLGLSQQIQIETGELVGQLDIELGLPVVFSMWRFGQDQQWIRCGDFTEDKQASVDGLHILQGNHESFKQALLDLIALAPELASKIVVIPTIMNTNELPPPPLDLCRDFTMSPSATPEPSSLIAAAAMAASSGAPNMTDSHQMMYHGSVPYGMINPQNISKANMSHLMLQAPFFYPSNTNNINENQPHSSDGFYQMQQTMMQQQQQQNMTYMNSNQSTSSNSTPSSLLM